MSVLEKKTTLVLGLGEIGGPLFEILKNHREGQVFGADVEPIDVSGDVDILHICYPFLVEPGFVEVSKHYAIKYRPKIIVINSTVSVGTTDMLEKETGIPAVFSPVRGKHTRMKADLRHYIKFVAGKDGTAVQSVRNQFERAGIKTASLASSSSLELAKLLETSYFGLLIGWAQEMNRFSNQINADYYDVTTFFSEIGYLPPVIFRPGFIGGHCVIPNIQLLKETYQSEFLNAIENSNKRRGIELGSADQAATERIQPLPIAKSSS